MCVKRRLQIVVGVGLVASACATTSPLVRQTCDKPAAQLARVLEPLETLRASGCQSALTRRGEPDCDELRRELERLLVVCPGYEPTMMANAVLAYEELRPARSQQILDQILAYPRSYPDAAALRARLAIEEGNLPFARRLLEQHIRLAPDHAGLHETLGAALYLGRELTAARRELATAGALGAPAWRIAYHVGLIEEADGRFDQARRAYADALTGNPSWAPAESRLRALRATDTVR
jgi:tetratricopeptide (TPR) repeat protein